MNSINSIKYRVLSMILACSIIFSNITIQQVYASNDIVTEVSDETTLAEEGVNNSSLREETEPEEEAIIEEEETEDEILFDEQSNDIDLSYNSTQVASPSNATPSDASEDNINTMETENKDVLTVNESYTYGIQNTGNIDGILGAKLVLTLTNITPDKLDVAALSNDSSELKELIGYMDGQEITYYLDTVTLKIGSQAEYFISLKSDAKQTYSIKGTFFARAVAENVTDTVTSKSIFEDTYSITSNTLRSDESENPNPDIDYEEKIFNIVFDSNGGSLVEPQKVRDGKTVVEPNDPTKDGYTFAGWYINDESWNFSTAVTEDITLKAKWEKDIVQYIITFDSDGGGLIDSQELVSGNTIEEPIPPTKPGYVFLGWYVDDVKWDFNDLVYEDTHLVAKWKSTDYCVISFNPNNGTTIPDQLVKKGEMVICPEYPVKAEYEFLGWFLNDVLYDFNEPVTDDITLDAKWHPAKFWAVLDSVTPFQFPEGAETFKLSKTPPPAGVKLYSLDAHNVPAGKNELYKSTYANIGWKSEGGIIVGWYDDESRTFLCYTNAKNLYYYGKTNVDLCTFKNVDLTGFDLAVSTQSLFKNWTDVEKINISTFNISTIKHINGSGIYYGFTNTFTNCKNLKEVILPSKSIAIKSAYGMFEGCENLEYADISCIDTETENSSNIIQGNYTIKFSPDLRYMFNGCKNLKQIKYGDKFVSPLCLMGSSGVQRKTYYNTDSMFKNCPANKPDWDTTDVGWTNINYSCSMFYKASFPNINPGTYSNLTQSIKWKIPKVGNQQSYTTNDYTSIKIGKCLEVPNEVLQRVPTGYYVKGWTRDSGTTSIQVPFDNYDYGDGLYEAILGIEEGYVRAGLTCSNSFNKEAVNFKKSPAKPDSSISTVDISEAADSSVVTWYDADSKTQYWYSDTGKLLMNYDSASFFANMKTLENISFDGMDFSYVRTMQSIFLKCTSLKSINLDGLNLNNVYNLSNFASGCTNLESIDFGNTSFEYIQDMSLMFQNCVNLKNVSFENFNSSRLTSLSKCFYGCSSLRTVDLSGISTANVTSYISMFENCTSLTSVEYGDSFTQPDISKLKNSESSSNITYKMLGNCKANLNKPKNWKDGNWNVLTGTYIVANMTVNFNTNYTNGGYLEPIVVRYGDSLLSVIDELPTVERDGGYILEGWYTSSSYKEKINLDVIVTSNVTYYAKWSRPGYANTGSTIKAAINNNAATFSQSKNAPDEGVATIDISEMKDGTVLTWYDSSTATQYWYSTTGIMHMNSDTSNLFNSKTKLKSIKLDNMDFSEVKTIYQAFYGCSALTELDLSTINLEKVTDSSYLCYGCKGLKEVKLGDWNTPVNENMSYMFYNNSNLNIIDVARWNGPLNKNLSYLFYNCIALKSINFLGLKTENVTNMTYEFYNCNSLQSLDLSEYDTNKVTSYKSMFEGCTDLSDIKYGENFKLKTGLTLSTGTSNATYKMFSGCNVDLNKPDLWTDGNWKIAEGTYIVADMTIRFNTNYAGGGYLDNIVVKYGEPLSSAITEMPTRDRGNGYILEGWYTTSGYTTKIGLDTIVTENTTYYAKWERIGYSTTGNGIKSAININAVSFVQSMEAPTPDIIVKDISECNDSSIVTWYDSASKIQYWYSTTGTMILNENSSGMFSGRSSLTSISLKNIDASNVTTLYQFFYNCPRLQTIEFAEWNTENVTNMSSLFSDCSALKSLDLSSFNTNKVTTMSYMFNACKALETIMYGNNFNNTTVTSFTKMFYTCTANKPDWSGTWDSAGTFKK